MAHDGLHGVSLQLGDDHECRGCWQLQEGTFEYELEEIVAHEDPHGRFIAITDARGMVERYPMGRDHEGISRSARSRLAIARPW
jgi:hypothetical protein